MANATIPDSVPSNPGGTGSTITVTLPTHSAGQVIKIGIGNTGNTLWTGNPAGWTRLDQKQVGTSANGLVQTFFQRLVLPGDTLPLANPTFTLGATVSRMAFAWAEDGASKEGVFTLPAWSARAFNTGTANPVRPGTITTPAPEGLITTVYFQRAATNAPDPSGYTQDEEVIISGTLVGNLSHKTVADQQTVLSNQDASPTSGVRWCAAIFCTPSDDYSYYRSASQATATGTFVTPGLPAGTTATDVKGNRDFMIITVEGAGSTNLSMQDGAWTEIGTWDTTTSGGGSTVSKFWTYMTGTPPSRQANRTGSGEISANICTYYNTHQSSPVGAANVRQNASSTSGTWDAFTRSFTKVTINASCVADATPSYTSPAGWTERSDGNGISTADQIFEAAGSTASASFTLSSASPNAAGLVEIKSHASESAAATLERSAALDGVGGIASSATFFTILERNTAVSVTASVTVAGARVVDGSSAIGAAGDIASAGEAFTLIEGAAALDVAGAITVSGVRVFDRSTETSVAASITVAAEFFSILERSVALDGAASVTVAGARMVDASIAFDGDGAITVSGEAFTLFEAAAAVSTSAAIVSSREFFSVLQTSAAVDATAAIDVSGVRVVSAASMIDAAGFVSVSGTVISGSGTHERSVSFDAVVATISSGLTIRERSVVIGTAVEIVTGYQRELLRATGIAATVTIAAAAVIDGGVVFNPTNVFNTDREMRILSISREGRIG